MLTNGATVSGWSRADPGSLGLHGWRAAKGCMTPHRSGGTLPGCRSSVRNPCLPQRKGVCPCCATETLLHTQHGQSRKVPGRDRMMTLESRVQDAAQAKAGCQQMSEFPPLHHPVFKLSFPVDPCGRKRIVLDWKGRPSCSWTPLFAPVAKRCARRRLGCWRGRPR